jgi:uroporphyrinogen-III synthase
MTTVLSTRILTPLQKKKLLSAGIQVADYNAITIEFKDVVLPDWYDYSVFTSKNGVKAYLQNTPPNKERNLNCFCVGQKTKLFLEKNGLKVIKTAENALELGKILVKSYKNASFLIFTGNRNRPELGKHLAENRIKFKELEVYTTRLTPKKFEYSFDGILFFSPSGIRSYTMENEMRPCPAFCIGETTATEAEKHTETIFIASESTVESVIEKVIHTLGTPIKNS